MYLAILILDLKIKMNDYKIIQSKNDYLYVEELEPWRKHIQKISKSKNYKRKKMTN